MNDTEAGESLTGSARLVEAIRRGYSITDERVLGALRAVDRRPFLDAIEVIQDGGVANDPYDDRPYSLRRAVDGTPLSSATAPSLCAQMIQALELAPAASVLEIGAATGYNAALLGHVVGSAGSVVSVEIDPELAELAAASVRRAGMERVAVRHGDGWEGYPDRAPYDAVIATMACWAVSPAWLEQLRPGGRFVAPLWLGPDYEAVAAMRRTSHGLDGRLLLLCSFNKPRGQAGGPPLSVRDPRAPGATLEVSAQLGGNPETLQKAQDIILAAEPAHTEVGTLVPSWFLRVALSDPGAFSLQRSEDNVIINLSGILDPETSSGAWLERRLHREPDPPHRMIGDLRWAHVGQPDILEHLQRYAANPHELELANLRLTIGAPQTPPPIDDPPHWELQRSGLVWRLWDEGRARRDPIIQP
jgi:protein-L-isoaspartate(D-aspartate) O-methyltransferase